jgi:hypothetical protein
MGSHSAKYTIQTIDSYVKENMALSLLSTHGDLFIK